MDPKSTSQKRELYFVSEKSIYVTFMLTFFRNEADNDSKDRMNWTASDLRPWREKAPTDLKDLGLKTHREKAPTELTESSLKSWREKIFGHRMPRFRSKADVGFRNQVSLKSSSETLKIQTTKPGYEVKNCFKN